MKDKFKKFLEIAKLLNHKFQIKPLLYGSLGLEVLTGENLNADDIDMLIPKVYIVDKWNDFMNCLEDNGYKMVDLHEHTFIKDELSFAFSFIESLENFANINESEIEEQNQNGVYYKLLNLEQYLAVYEASSKDDYRKKIAKTEKDEKKIKLIKCFLNKNI